MRHLFAFFAVFFVSSSYAQFYIGYSESEVFRYVNKTNISGIQRKTLDDGTKVLFWNDYTGNVQIECFFKNSVVDYSVFVPLTQESLQQWLMVVNQNFIKETETEWTGYVQDIKIKILLKYIPNSKSYGIFFYRTS